MKILYIHNNYAGNNSGEEHAAEGIVNLLQQNGHTVEWYRRSSNELKNSVIKKIMAFFTGVWNPIAVREVRQKLNEFQPDVVQIQNLYPLISPAIIKAIKKTGIPIVMRCPNYRLFCPTGLHLDNKRRVCEKCLGYGREIHCILKNCENNIFKSTGYALRNFTARKFWNILTDVNIYIVQSEFQKQKFITNGIPEEKIIIIPGLTPDISKNIENRTGTLVTFVGRASEEKGIEEFVEAAKELPEIPFAVAGNINSSLSNLKNESPKNINWTGFLKGESLDKLYSNSRIIVVPSKWYEGFPNVITRAMKHGKPVITSNLGAMASIINHEQNGLLVEPGNIKELVKAIKHLYSHPETSIAYGKNGRKKANECYSSEVIYSQLINMYQSVIQHN